MLLPSSDGCPNIYLCQFCGNLFFYVIYECIDFIFSSGSFILDFCINLRFKIVQAEVFQSRFDGVHTHSSRQWGIDIQCLCGNKFLFPFRLKAKGPHIVKPVG